VFKFIALSVICWGTVSNMASSSDFETERQANWHQWRGPMANGVAPHAQPPVKWSETDNVQWKTPIPGDGSCTPIVWGDRVFVTSALKTDREVVELPPLTAEPPGGYKTERPRSYYRFIVFCVDRNSGRVRWRHTATEAIPHEGCHSTNSYASGSPTTDGERLYVSFGSRGLFCCDLEGHLLWSRDLGDMVTRSGWGEANTPVIHQNSLVVSWDHEGDSSLYVLDPKTGDIRWSVPRDEVSGWSTPLVHDRADRTQVIVNATRRVTSYDLADGSIIWECGGQTVNCIPSPVAADDVVYCMSGFRGNALLAISLDATGDITNSDRIVWQRNRGTPYVPSPLLTDHRLFFTASNRAVLSCLDARTGDVLMEQTRLPGLSSLYASPASAADRVYFVGRDGTTLVIRKGPKLEVLATNRLDDPIDGSPAIVGKQMFLRGHNFLYCLKASSNPQG